MASRINKVQLVAEKLGLRFRVHRGTGFLWLGDKEYRIRPKGRTNWQVNLSVNQEPEAEVVLTEDKLLKTLRKLAEQSL